MCVLKTNVLALVVQKLQPEHTHIHTDSTEIITYPHTRMVITGASCNSISFISYLHKLESNSATWVLLYQESRITYC